MKTNCVCVTVQLCLEENNLCKCNSRVEDTHVIFYLPSKKYVEGMIIPSFIFENGAVFRPLISSQRFSNPRLLSTEINGTYLSLSLSKFDGKLLVK